MSEKEKTIVELKKEDRELLQSAIKAFKAPPKTSQIEKNESETTATTEHTHFNVELGYLEAEDSCPECKKGLDQFGKAYMKKVLTERKDLEYECEECGTPVGEEEEECPTCGSKEARSR